MKKTAITHKPWSIFSALNLTRFDWWMLIAVVIVAMVIRVYNIQNFLFFGFEQGLDALRVRDIVNGTDYRLVGTKTDIDGIFQGGLWYYLLVIPYVLSNGHPVVTAVFIAFINVLAVVAVFGVARLITGSHKWGWLAGWLAVFSFDFITYARWISITSPAMLGVTLAMGALWLYHQTKNGWYVVAFALLASLSAQFQIIHILSFFFVVVALLITKQVVWPKLKFIIWSLIAGALVFSPYILFNLRNQWITVSSALHYLSGQDDKMVYRPSLSESLSGYSNMLFELVSRSVFTQLGQWVTISIIIIAVLSIVLLITHSQSRAKVLFLLIWTFMSLPLLLFTQSLGLHQLYVGSSSAILILVVYLTQQFWIRRHKLSLLLIPLWVLIGVSSFNSIHSVVTNQRYYFVTAQTGLNLKDQLELLDAIADDTGGNGFRLQAFTIPYYQPQAWEYLYTWRYPETPINYGDFIHIVIQPNVEQYWENQWIKDLGKTDLIFEKQVGELRWQKRLQLPQDNP